MEEPTLKYAAGRHPNSLKNIQEHGFKPGRSGNPKGRPRNTRYISEILREQINQPCPYKPDKTWGEYLVERWLGHAVENPTFFKELMDRLEGKVTQPIEIEGDTKVTFTIGKGYTENNGEKGYDERSTTKPSPNQQ